VEMSSPRTPEPSPARLVVLDGHVALATEDQTVSLTALEIFGVAIRGATEARGHSVDPEVGRTAPGIRFHQGFADVALHLRSPEGDAVASTALKHRDAWAEVRPVAPDDHVLVGEDWYPLDPGSWAAVEGWLARNAPPHKLTPAEYSALYRRSDRGFDIVDELTDECVQQLGGALADFPQLEATLYPYQERGFRWLSAHAEGAVGGILGDEMGLGKTLQIIALLTQRLKAHRGPSLIVVPLTLVENWSREFRRFAPDVPIYRHLGPGRTRRPLELAKSHVVITSYETAVIDEAVLTLVNWDTVVVDEAQAIKNPDTLRAQALKALPRRVSFAVTGTPLENRTSDVWSLADFAVPSYLGTRREFDETLAAEPDLLRRSIRPILLRREVSQVARDLPEKIEIDVALEMFSSEAAGYEQVRQSLRGSTGRTPILALITKLRMFTAHPDSVLQPAASPALRSAKLTRLLEILEEVFETGAKALVFVAYQAPSDIILDAVMRRCSVPGWVIDGRMPVAERQSTIDHFSQLSGGAFLVLNPTAAGVGLNIAAASHVIHYTLEWNPAREAQATARAWRRGQERPVTVHRLYYINSIDELLVEKLETKRDLAARVVQPSPDDETDLRALLAKALSLRSPVTEGETRA
jgi:SNF2 family DNA or RNA helicase